MDAQYVHGMLANPNIQPNATMNRWITAILLFTFKLVHVPAEKHQGPDGLSTDEGKKTHHRTRHFLLHDGQLWRRHAQGRHQLVIIRPTHLLSITCEAHDKLGHKGFYSTLRSLRDHFWWPSLADDVKWFIKTCHECQTRQTTKVHIPPTVSTPATLFRKVYVDTMLMPLAAGYRYLVQARCS